MCFTETSCKCRLQEAIREHQGSPDGISVLFSFSLARLIRTSHLYHTQWLLLGSVALEITEGLWAQMFSEVELPAPVWLDAEVGLQKSHS